MALTKEEQRAWLAQHTEEIIDPGREIIDPHHHMWRASGLPVYLLEDLWEDTESGHRIVKTVFMEWGQSTELRALSILKLLEKRSSLEMQLSPVEAGKTEIAVSSPMQTSLQTWTFCEKLWKLTRRLARACFGVSDMEVRMTRIKALVG